MKTKINIAVTGTGSLIGQAIIKSILRSNLKDKFEIIGFDYFNYSVGSFWIHENHILPDILDSRVNQKDWLDVIVETIIKKDIKLLFVGLDFELPVFATYKKFIEDKTNAIVLVSSPEVIKISDDKFLTYEFLKNNKLYHPKSYLVNNLHHSNLNYPLIIKPRKGERSRGVHKVFDENQLYNLIDKIENPIIQEYIGEDYNEFTCGTIYLGNELKEFIILKRSLKDGNTFISKYRNNFPDIISSYLREVVNCLKPFGSCNFQLRIDNNGIPKIFEINARHSGTTYIRSLFGFKEIEYIINNLLFGNEIKFNLKEGTAVRYFDEFFIKK